MTTLIFLGSDPELFTRDHNGNVSSVAGKLGADKYHKKEISHDVRIQEDNVLVEFDINPHNSFDSFNDNMRRGIEACDVEARKIGNEVDLDICSHIFSADELKSFHRDAFVFGCEPDYNALTGMINPKPEAPEVGLRTAGGHIHIGYDNDREVTEHGRAVLGVMCDYFLGMPSILLDSDDRRKELYGKAGACRYKTYGIEYRVLSNFWTTKERNRLWAWEQAHKAYLNSLEDYKILSKIVTPQEVQRVINTNDKAMAEQYIKLLEVM